MLYPIAIERGNEQEAFGVIFPDVEGCFSAGDSYEEALTQAKEALEFHLEALAEDGILPPAPTKIDDLINNPEYRDMLWSFVDVDIEPFLGGSEKKNVTLPKLLSFQIDNAVKANKEFKDRSSFLQIAAMKLLQEA